MAVIVNIQPGEVDQRARFVQDLKVKIEGGDQRRLFYLVPNHVKFDGEVDVLKRLGTAQGKQANDTYAQSQVQVYSLTRLAWRFLQDQGKVQPPVLGSAGLFVMVSKILQEQKDSLPVFARMAAKQGFIEKLVSQLSELRASRVSAQDLLSIVEQIEGQDQQMALTASALKQKLRDLAIVADAFNDNMGDDYILAQETLPYLVQQVQDMDLSNAVFYFDGFTGFTAAEWALVKLLIEKAEVHFAMLGRVDANDPLKYENGASVYEKPLETTRTIRTLAHNAGVEFQVKVGARDQKAGAQAQASTTATPSATPSHAKFQPAPSQQHLLQAWEKLGAYQDFSADEQEKSETNLESFVAANVVTELEEVARRIREDLRQNPDLHLRDVLVLARDLNPYTAKIPAVMESFELPYFLDNDVKMGNHPLVELTTTLLKNPHALYQKENILTVLKTGYLRPIMAAGAAQSQNTPLTPNAPLTQTGQKQNQAGPNPDRVQSPLQDDTSYFEAVAYLENYLAGHRVSRKTWEDDSKPFELYQVPLDDESQVTDHDKAVNAAITQLKLHVHALIKDLTETFEKADTIEAAGRAFMAYLQDKKVPDAVMEQRDQLIDDGQLMKAQQLMEVWQLFISILDQTVQVAGNDDFDRKTFLQALEAGFSGGTFAGIPNQLDQLTISEAGIVQSQSYKKLYFIGGTRNAFPAQVNNKTLLSDQDRLLVQPALAEQDDPRYLQETAKQQMAQESLVFYNALQAASDKVTLSYPLLDQDGNVNEPSPYFARLQAAFGIDKSTPIAAQAKDPSDLVKHFAGTPQATLGQLVKLPEEQRANQDFQAVKESLKKAGNPARTDRVLSSADYENKPEQLTQELAKQLFQTPLVVSISQVESFYRNPYEYFLRYGLRLREKPTVEIDARIEGTVYHALFEQVVNEVIKANGRLADVTDETFAQQVQAKLQELSTQAEFAELTEEGQGQAQARFMEKQAVKVLQQLRTATRLNNTSKPTRVEAPFGFPGSDLPMVTIGKGAHEVLIRGKVDRFDRQDGQGEYGTIVDYKLNGKKFSYKDAANGLELQLLTYWQAANENAQKMGLATNGHVGGAFFAPINQKKTAWKDFKGSVDELLEGKLPAQSAKLAGLTLTDDAYVDALDQIEASGKSASYNLAKKKDGNLSAKSDGIAPEELDLLMAHNQKLIQQAAQQITKGQFPLNPVEKSLTYSAYTDVMRFDRALGDSYQEAVYNGKKKQILEALVAESAENTNEGSAQNAEPNGPASNGMPTAVDEANNDSGKDGQHA
ncbi:ATP-dependent helicase [Fructobacillus sp. M2-14]|uniref:ATP-dependent helicase n=1 Tax=Fructobacillus broussonetiae TaxID=2713173 RepID=A0ABS5R098_9LACO|nr:PD-(D/E)XK nuclease family protein [Fructobacillus broussonetiae]MBS9338859.1 ATP-dependent helicase [Fructobacillus broussonetiae]